MALQPPDDNDPFDFSGSVGRHGDMPSTDIVAAERHRQTGEPVGFNSQSDIRRDLAERVGLEWERHLKSNNKR
ncbi:MAG: hypothetical protein OJJ21_18895 [Ferrovibrio sp.]|uniref:hypothetical protein n=1 Tax=Ferrovibrio sp. TaxID=1917215 RepID=UPI00262E8307|nr:hypothetical protein [Ferrovibrio sp.]MCW0235675.1 hypothetical protein [Ferrovibrio sp.]